jgi:hypothetical protein
MTGTKYSTDIDDNPRTKHHTHRRWRKRTDATIGVEEAWKQAIKVDAPEVDGERVRLYAPTDSLLMVRDMYLRTVLHADYDRLDVDDYPECEQCNNLNHPDDADTCTWCGCQKPISPTTMASPTGFEQGAD